MQLLKEYKAFVQCINFACDSMNLFVPLIVILTIFNSKVFYSSLLKKKKSIINFFFFFCIAKPKNPQCALLLITQFLQIVHYIQTVSLLILRFINHFLKSHVLSIYERKKMHIAILCLSVTCEFVCRQLSQRQVLHHCTKFVHQLYFFVLLEVDLVSSIKHNLLICSIYIYIYIEKILTVAAKLIC